MIFDFLSHDLPLRWESQIVIVGTGPAGLTLAQELSEIAEVLLLEAGGVEPHPGEDKLLQGECVGIAYPLTQSRARQFGGSSGLWAGYCAQFDAQDFMPRDWVPESGWPFGIEAVQPYYARVAELLNLNEPDFDAHHFAGCSESMLPFDLNQFVPTVWRFGNPIKRFGDALLDKFASSHEITTLTHATVTDIRLDAYHSAVTELIIRAANGREGRVMGSLFILAAGGIETPRLLLQANSQVRHGLGNASGLVGRCFMEHPHRCIKALLLNGKGLEKWTRRLACDDDRQFTFCLGLSLDSQRNAKLINARAHVYRTPDMLDDEVPRVGLFMEQAPNRKSRLTLADSRDVFGMRRVRLDWRLTELDWTSYKGTASLIAEEFERLKLGRLTTPLDEPLRDSLDVQHSNHHLGTTRMSDDPGAGVVDANCKFHDLENLYAIGGNIFPTASWANPTFNLLALTLRLAEHLKMASVR